MEETSHKLKEYINEISSIQEENPFNRSDLEKCINNYDFSEEEKKKLVEIASGHSKRSEEMLRIGKIEGAIVSMERAVEIFPLSSEFRNRLSQLYLQNSDKEKARDHAGFSLLLDRKSPIAKNILKEIKTKEDKQTGRDLNKKLIILFTSLILLIVIAILSRNSFDLPFLNDIQGGEEQITESLSIVQKPVEFTERQVITDTINFPEDLEIEIQESLIEKTNGSFSYTLQGTIQSDKELIKSADLNILFRDYKGDEIFRKVIPLLKNGENLYPGETVLIDEFFYIHYLPPEIAEVDLKLTDLSVADEVPERESALPLKVEWTESRPDGVKLAVFLNNMSALQGYTEGYANLKLQLRNQGHASINSLNVDLRWRDRYGSILHSINKDLIEEGNLPLQVGENRLFHIFTEIPLLEGDEETEILINVNRINS